MEKEDLARAADMTLALSKEVEERVVGIILRTLGASEQEIEDENPGWLMAKHVWNHMKHNVDFRLELMRMIDDAQQQTRYVVAPEGHVKSAPFVYNAATPVASSD